MMVERAEPGVFIDLATATREAAMRALDDAEAPPIAAADDLVAVFAGPALQAVIAARVKLFVAGHTPDNDEMLPLQLADEARRHAASAIDAIGLTAQDRDLAAAEASLAKTAAFCMAAIDRLRTAQGKI